MQINLFLSYKFMETDYDRTTYYPLASDCMIQIGLRAFEMTNVR